MLNVKVGNETVLCCTFTIMQCAGQHCGGHRLLVKIFCFLRNNFASFVVRDVTLLFGLYAVMVNNCSGG
jgi:hypothetical protein